MTFPIEWCHCENCPRRPWPTFWMLKCFKCYFFEMAKCAEDICRFCDLPSNGFIAKIVLHDLDLLFKGQRFDLKHSHGSVQPFSCGMQEWRLESILLTVSSNLSGATCTSKGSNRDLHMMVHAYSYLECKWLLRLSCIFTSTCTASVVELLLFNQVTQPFNISQL